MLITRFRVGIPIKPSSFTNNKCGTTNPKLTHLHFLCKYSSISQIPREKQEEEEPINKKNHSSSLTLSYLINSCGLSSQSALSASKTFNIKTTEKPDSVLNFFKSYGFTNTHITKLITKLPTLLTSNPDTTLRPKLEFLLDIGFSNTQLTDLITSCPNFLVSSLENRIRPNFDLLRSVLNNNNQQVAAAIQRSSHASCLLRDNLTTNFLPNVRILQGYGVPGPHIAKLAIRNAMCLKKKTDEFAAVIESIKKMGFNPLSTLFFHGVHVKLGMSTATWKKKVGVLKSLGWSEEEVISAFVRQPYCMGASEEKLRRSMDFFVKQMHWKPSIVATHPVLLNLSLEKRVIPRCSVFNVLVSKGLVKNTSVMFLKISETDFLNNYVLKYQERAPEVLRAYNSNLGSAGFQ